MKTPPLQHPFQHLRQSPRRQRGMVLFIALIVLVAMTLAGIGMVRSVDTTNLIAGNLAFKQGTVQGADVAVNAAAQWLVGLSGTATLLNSDNSNDSDASNAYFSSRPAAEPDWSLPATWVNQRCLNVGCAPDATTGNVASYVIHRMCTLPGVAFNGADAGGTQNQCALYNPATAGGGGANAPKDGDSVVVHRAPGTPPPGAAGSSDISVYFRITARVRGPRDTLSIVQTMVMMPE